MKRTSILILIGAFLVTTCYLALGKDEKMYQKKKAFTTKDEIVETINNKPLQKEIAEYRRETTDEFNECLSERLRVTDRVESYYKIDIEDQVDLDDETKNYILKAYEKLRKSYYNARPISNIDVIRVKAQCYHSKDHPSKEKRDLDIIFIDEGEGLVIDYLDDKINERYGIEE